VLRKLVAVANDHQRPIVERKFDVIVFDLRSDEITR
jgi:hypothetical protein